MTDTQEVARLEGMLAFDIDENGAGLTPAKKAEIEAKLSVLRGDPEADEQDQALRSLLGTQAPESPQIKGACPICGFPDAMNGTCSNCGNDFDPADTVQETRQPSEGDRLASIEAQLAALAKGQGVAAPQPTITLKDVLDSLDPRDSDAALALFGWLWDNHRFGVVGQLNGGGYLLHYQEPKGSTQAGYMAGGTQGSRMVDAAVEKTKAAGGRAVKRGLCATCMSAVKEREDGVVVLDDDENQHPEVCPGSTDGHTMVS